MSGGKKLYLGWNKDCELAIGRPTEWNQQRGFGPEHPYHDFRSRAGIPDVIKTHAQIREEKAAAAIEATHQPQSEEKAAAAIEATHQPQSSDKSESPTSAVTVVDIGFSPYWP